MKLAVTFACIEGVLHAVFNDTKVPVVVGETTKVITPCSENHGNNEVPIEPVPVNHTCHWCLQYILAQEYHCCPAFFADYTKWRMGVYVQPYEPDYWYD